MQHVWMAPRGAGGRTGCVQQNRVELMFRLPCQRIRAHGAGRKPGAFQIGFEQFEAPLGNIERGDLPALRRQLQSLAARCCTQVEHVAAFSISKQPCRERRGDVLYPPGTFGKAWQFFDVVAARQAQVAGHQAVCR